MADYGKKANSLNEFDTMRSCPKVMAKKTEMINNTKRNFKKPRELGEDRRAKKKEDQIERRDSLLELAIVEGQMETLCDRKKARITN
jgi:hypothetical protein